MKDASIDISIVIVTWNSWHYLEPCLTSLYACTNPQLHLEIIVVDNGSQDNLAGQLPARFRDVLLIANDDNLGFARASNQGIRRAVGKYILLLNPDTVFQDDVLSRLMALAEGEQAGVVVGPQLLSPDGTAQSASARRLPGLCTIAARLIGLERLQPSLYRRLTAYPPDRDQTVEAISGACTLVPAALFAQVGLLDETMPMGGEDIDWYKRAQNAGIVIRYLHQPRLLHIGGASRALALERTDMAGYAALYYYFKKHHGSGTAGAYLLLLLLTTLLKLAAWLAYAPVSGSRSRQVFVKIKIGVGLIRWILWAEK